jgi:hypothetical protein
MVTCRSRQTIESPGEAGVGNILTSVAVGGGVAVIVTGVTDSPVEEQAVNINNPIKFFNRTLGGIFIQEIKIL